MRKLVSTLMGISLVVFGGSAFAQGTDPNTGATTGGTTGGTTTATTPTTTQTPSTTSNTPATNAPAKDDEQRDHEKVAGHLGVGYFGINNIPIANQGGGAGSVSAPVIGARYWLDAKLGIDVGLGIGWSGGSTEVANGGNTVSTDKAGRLGFALHGGVPIALAGSKHFTFEVIPELNFGYATSTIKGTAGAADTDLSGLLLSLGGRVGAEIQFGFIGIPELALQGSVGLYLAHTSTKAKTTIGGSDASQSDSSTGISTVSFSDPWALFTNNISALYYF